MLDTQNQGPQCIDQQKESSMALRIRQHDCGPATEATLLGFCFSELLHVFDGQLSKMLGCSDAGHISRKTAAALDLSACPSL